MSNWQDKWLPFLLWKKVGGKWVGLCEIKTSDDAWLPALVVQTSPEGFGFQRDNNRIEYIRWSAKDVLWRPTENASAVN